MPHAAGAAGRRVTAAGLSTAERRALAQIDPVALLSDLDTLVTAHSLDGDESTAQRAAAGGYNLVWITDPSQLARMPRSAWWR